MANKKEAEAELNEYRRLYDSLWEHYNENHPFSLAEWMKENKEAI